MPEDLREPLRFRKIDRLLARAEFRHVYEHGRKCHSQLFTAFFLPGQEGRDRIGLTVTRKVGKSHERNRCRRQLRELFRNHRRTVEGKGLDLVLNVRREMLRSSFSTIEAEFLKLLARLDR